MNARIGEDPKIFTQEYKDIKRVLIEHGADQQLAKEILSIGEF